MTTNTPKCTHCGANGHYANACPWATITRNLVAIIDEELLPNIGKLALRDYGRLNDTLIAARKLLG